MAGSALASTVWSSEPMNTGSIIAMMMRRASAWESVLAPCDATASMALQAQHGARENAGLDFRRAAEDGVGAEVEIARRVRQRLFFFRRQLQRFVKRTLGYETQGVGAERIDSELGDVLTQLAPAQLEE